MAKRVVLRRKWTEADDALLRELISKKVSLAIIAVRLKRSRERVARRARDFGLVVANYP